MQPIRNTLALVVLLVCAPTSAQDVETWLRQIQGGDARKAEAVVHEVIGGGDAALSKLLVGLVDHETLKEDDAGREAIRRDAQARQLIQGFVMTVTAPGSDGDRRTLARFLTFQLRQDHPTTIKAFFIRQLRIIGDDEHSETVASLLQDPALADDALATLATIGGTRAVTALREALPGATGHRQAAIIAVLGDLEDDEAAGPVAAALRTSKASIRGLARIADSYWVEDLLVLDQESVASHRHENAAALLGLAARLEAQPEQAKRIYDHLWETRSGIPDRAVRIAALQGMVDLEGAGALARVEAALTSADPQLRGAAAELGAAMVGPGVSAKWRELLWAPEVETRITLLRLFQLRDAVSQFKIVTGMLTDADERVRRAAMPVVAALGGARAVEPLSRLLTDRRLRKSAEETLVQLQPRRGSEITPGNAIARQVLADPDSEETRLLVGVLAKRRDLDQAMAVMELAARSANGRVRTASLKAVGALISADDFPLLLMRLSAISDGREREEARKAAITASGRYHDKAPARAAILRQLDDANPPTRAALLRVLAQVGGADALQVVSASLADPDGSVKESAIRALADWPDDSAVPALIGVIENSSELKHQVLAVRGCLKLIDGSRRPDAEKVELYRQVLAQVGRDEERREVLGSLSKVRTIEALDTVAPFLESEGLQREAAHAVVRIACPTGRRKQGLEGPSTIAALEKAVQKTENAELRSLGRSHLENLEGFASLFNGRNLRGWQGATDGYVAENGALVCHKGHGGNLYTAKEYSDFILRFEFKLAPGSNNGLGLRAPLKGDAAYVGLECQILDDTAEKFASLKPWQYHGSIYGVVACKRGHQKPVGEWNEQEVIYQGTRIKVILNGTVIVDADLADSIANGTLDGREHPGLKRTSGHIGFLGHGDYVAFRNLRIKELK